MLTRYRSRLARYCGALTPIVATTRRAERGRLWRTLVFITPGQSRISAVPLRRQAHRINCAPDKLSSPAAISSNLQSGQSNRRCARRKGDGCTAATYGSNIKGPRRTLSLAMMVISRAFRSTRMAIVGCGESTPLMPLAPAFESKRRSVLRRPLFARCRCLLVIKAVTGL
jgi:hypothetical protein